MAAMGETAAAPNPAPDGAGNGDLREKLALVAFVTVAVVATVSWLVLLGWLVLTGIRAL